MSGPAAALAVARRALGAEGRQFALVGGFEPEVVSPDDIDQAGAAVRLIEERGYGRGRDLVAALRDLVA